MPENFFDIVWVGPPMYSSIPLRSNRVTFLNTLKRSLKPGGYLSCHFKWGDEQETHYIFIERVIRKLVAILTAGNLMYEKGDKLLDFTVFFHAFYSKTDLHSEFKESDLEILYSGTDPVSKSGEALLRKPEIVTAAPQ